MRLHSAVLQFLAVLTLLVWTGAVQHDVWLGWLGVNHHHDHSAGHDHHGHTHHDHSHQGDSDHDHHDSIPLPNTHEDPITMGSSKISIAAPELPVSAVSLLAGFFDAVLPSARVISCDHPPPDRAFDELRPAHIPPVYSVGANAPPRFV
ncbi:MAG: hypothetical protein AAF491_12110 [Verrucomicrobiota bacterium]